MDGQLHVLTGDHACAYWCLNMCHREETTVQFQGRMARRGHLTFNPFLLLPHT